MSSSKKQDQNPIIGIGQVKKKQEKSLMETRKRSTNAVPLSQTKPAPKIKIGVTSPFNKPIPAPQLISPTN